MRDIEGRKRRLERERAARLAPLPDKLVWGDDLAERRARVVSRFNFHEIVKLLLREEYRDHGRDVTYTDIVHAAERVQRLTEGFQEFDARECADQLIELYQL